MSVFTFSSSSCGFVSILFSSSGDSARVARDGLRTIGCGWQTVSGLTEEQSATKCTSGGRNIYKKTNKGTNRGAVKQLAVTMYRLHTEV